MLSVCQEYAIFVLLFCYLTCSGNKSNRNTFKQKKYDRSKRAY